MTDAVVARHSWVVRRFVTITRERVEFETGTETQYTVRIWDSGRNKPFIENSFANLTQAEKFADRIRKESEYSQQSTEEI